MARTVAEQLQGVAAVAEQPKPSADTRATRENAKSDQRQPVRRFHANFDVANVVADAETRPRELFKVDDELRDCEGGGLHAVPGDDVGKETNAKGIHLR